MSSVLDDDVKVGFSIQNLTGQPVRYLQHWEGGKDTVQYVHDGQRGLLNFVPSATLIRNNQILEEAFNVQMDHLEDPHNRNRKKKKLVGHQVALQVMGFKWLAAVQADELGFKYEDLHAVTGRHDLSQLYPDRFMTNALKLVAEVVPKNGGRMLRLRSVFTIKNNTTHAIKILAKENSSAATHRPFSRDKRVDSLGLDSFGPAGGDDGKQSEKQDDEGGEDDVPYFLNAGDSFYVPLALLYRSAFLSRGKSLGKLFICPSDISPVEEELGARPHVETGHVDYSAEPIDLLSTAHSETQEHHLPHSRSADSASPTSGTRPASNSVHFDFGGMAANARSNPGSLQQLCCEVRPKNRRYQQSRNRSGSDNGEERSFSQTAGPRLPLFCYNVEVQRSTTGAAPTASSLAESREKNVLETVTGLSAFFQQKGARRHHGDDAMYSPVHYTIGKSYSSLTLHHMPDRQSKIANSIRSRSAFDFLSSLDLSQLFTRQ
jgi:hypothetical protein